MVIGINTSKILYYFLVRKESKDKDSKLELVSSLVSINDRELLRDVFLEAQFNKENKELRAAYITYETASRISALGVELSNTNCREMAIETIEATSRIIDPLEEEIYGSPI